MVIETFDTIFMSIPLIISLITSLIIIIILFIFCKQKEFIYHKKEYQFHTPSKNTFLIRKPPCKPYLIHEIQIKTTTTPICYHVNIILN